MVKSGLVENPDVSHFRLSAHLIIAFVIYSLMLFFLWTTLTLARRNFEISDENSFKVADRKSNGLNIFLLLFSISLLLITVVSGAFVAGTKAGWAYNNFPLMGDNILPPILINQDHSGFEELLNDLGFIQFFHRILASTTLDFFDISCYLLCEKWDYITYYRVIKTAFSFYICSIHIRNFNIEIFCSN